MSARIIIGAAAGVAAAAFVLAGVGVAAVIAGIVAGGLLLPASLFGSEGGDGFVDASGGGGGGGS